MPKDIPLELRDASLVELGRITARFATLEFMTGNLVSWLVGPNDDAGRVIVSAMPFRRRLDVIDSLVRLSTDEPELLEQTKATLRQATLAEDRRNSFMHSMWCEQSETLEGEPTTCAGRLKFTARRGKGLRQQVETLLPSQMREIADEILSAFESLSDLWFALGKAGLLHSFEVAGENPELDDIGHDTEER